MADDAGHMHVWIVMLWYTPTVCIDTLQGNLCIRLAHRVLLRLLLDDCTEVAVIVQSQITARINLPEVSGSLNVEDDASLVPVTGRLHSGFVPGDGFDGTAQLVTLRIVGYAGGTAPQR